MYVVPVYYVPLLLHSSRSAAALSAYTPATMAPRKRARTSSTGGSSSSSSTAVPTITLDGGEPCPTKQVALWRSGRLTDTVVTVEGATFAAHRLVLAARATAPARSRCRASYTRSAVWIGTLCTI